MNKIMKWLEEKLVPIMDKINSNIWIVVIKETINAVLPIIMLGSVFCLLWVFNKYLNLPIQFWDGYAWTFGKISLYVSFILPFYYCEKKRYRNLRFAAAIAGVILFAIVASPTINAEGSIGLSSDCFGAGGMFVALTTGVIVSLIFELFHKFSFFKESSVLPSFIKNMFDMMIPIGVTFVLGWIPVLIMGLDLYAIIQSLFLPLIAILNTLPGFCLYQFLAHFLYSLGISNWIMAPVVTPTGLANIASNAELAAAGLATAQNLSLFTAEVRLSSYLGIGGLGSTLALVIMMMFSKSKKLKSLGRVGILPSIFNINEPIVYGCIAWNPIMMIPFLIVSLTGPCVVWLFTKVIEFAPIPTTVFSMWYCPYPVCTWLTTGSIRGIILFLIMFALSALIYYPFFKLNEKHELELEEAEKNEEK